MKKPLLALTSALTALVLPGCLQSETTIHLNKDGSGTLVEETRLGAQMLGMIEQMSALGGGEAKADPLAEMCSEDKAKARASKLGEGVVFTKSETVSKDGAKGARVTYTFKDINQLKVSPGDGMKDMSPAGAAPPAAEKTEPIAFSYADGKLTVKMPPQDEDAKEKAGAADADEALDMDNPQTEAMMKQMLGDMKMSLKLVIEPGIAESNATHADGNTITLMEMEMGKLLEKPENMKKLAKMSQKEPTASMEALKGIDGVKFEAKEEITVKLK